MKHYHREVLKRLKAEGYAAVLVQKGAHYKLKVAHEGREATVSVSITPTNEHYFVLDVLKDVRKLLPMPQPA